MSVLALLDMGGFVSRVSICRTSELTYLQRSCAHVGEHDKLCCIQCLEAGVDTTCACSNDARFRPTPQCIRLQLVVRRHHPNELSGESLPALTPASSAHPGALGIRQLRGLQALRRGVAEQRQPPVVALQRRLHQRVLLRLLLLLLCRLTLGRRRTQAMGAAHPMKSGMASCSGEVRHAVHARQRKNVRIRESRQLFDRSQRPSQAEAEHPDLCRPTADDMDDYTWWDRSQTRQRCAGTLRSRGTDVRRRSGRRSGDCRSCGRR